MLGQLSHLQSLEIKVDSLALRFGGARLELEIQVQYRLGIFRVGSGFSVLRSLSHSEIINLAG
jgi:hypothetical protein